MQNSRIEEADNTNSYLETEGLPGIELRKEDHSLRIDGAESNFVDGKGTSQEPFEPRASLSLEVSLKDANYLAALLKEHYGLKSTVFVRHGSRLLGVDANAHVQFIRDKEWSSEESWQKETEWLRNFLGNIKNEKNNPTNWMLYTVDKT